MCSKKVLSQKSELLIAYSLFNLEIHEINSLFEETKSLPGTDP